MGLQHGRVVQKGVTKLQNVVDDPVDFMGLDEAHKVVDSSLVLLHASTGRCLEIVLGQGREWILFQGNGASRSPTPHT